MPSSGGSFQPRDWTQVSQVAGRFFTSWATREIHKGNQKNLNIEVKFRTLLNKQEMDDIYIITISVQFSCSVVSYSLQPHGLQDPRPPCLSPTPGVYINSCPLSRWCHLAISSSAIPFSYLQSFPASGSFPMSQLFTSGGPSIGVSASASVLPVNTQDWSPLGWTGWIP